VRELSHPRAHRNAASEVEVRNGFHLDIIRLAEREREAPWTKTGYPNALFGLKPLTGRDAAANRLNSLISLSVARSDAPTKLPDPAGSAAGHPASILAPPPAGIVTTVSRPQASANDGNLPGVIHAALRQDLEVSPQQDRAAILARAGSIKTRDQASQYLEAVRAKVRVRRAKDTGR